MTKKNNYIKNLEKEKMRLRIQQLELEKQIQRDWKEITTHFSTTGFFSDKPESSARQTATGGLMQEAINFGISFLSAKISDKAGQKIESALHRGFESFSKKRNPASKKNPDRK